MRGICGSLNLFRHKSRKCQRGEAKLCLSTSRAPAGTLAEVAGIIVRRSRLLAFGLPATANILRYAITCRRYDFPYTNPPRKGSQTKACSRNNLSILLQATVANLSTGSLFLPRLVVPTTW